MIGCRAPLRVHAFGLPSVVLGLGSRPGERDCIIEQSVDTSGQRGWPPRRLFDTRIGCYSWAVVYCCRPQGLARLQLASRIAPSLGFVRSGTFRSAIGSTTHTAPTTLGLEMSGLLCTGNALARMLERAVRAEGGSLASMDPSGRRAQGRNRPYTQHAPSDTCRPRSHTVCAWVIGGSQSQKEGERET